MGVAYCARSRGEKLLPARSRLGSTVVDTPARKLSFENGGDFILETRREVELYLGSAADAPRRAI